MNSLQLTRGKARINRKFATMRAARERHRLNPEPLPDEPDIAPSPLGAVKYASVSLRIGRERVTFRVWRLDERRLVMRGKAQAASSIGRRIALTLEAML